MAGSFWERQEGETPKQFAAFAIYRDQGPTRSLRKTAEEVYGEGTASVRRIEEWSRENMWVARVEAYDAETDRAERLELEQHRREMNRRHRQIAKFAQSKAVETLNSLKPGTLPASQIAPILNVSANLERLATGETTQNIAQHLSGDALAASPEWARTKAAVVGALREHPAALEAVVEALTNLEENDVA